MAQQQALPGELMAVRPFGDHLAWERTRTLVKSATMELLRLVVPEGTQMPYYGGEVLLQCVEGQVGVQVNGRTRQLQAGDLLYLAGDRNHTVRGITDASLLVTILQG